MNSKLKKSTAALLLATILPTVPMAHATGIPTFDGAAATSAMQQLMSWQARFESLMRDKMTQIPGVQQFVDSRREGEIEGLFQRRINLCERMRRSNPTSTNLCVNTVKLEKQKYALLKHMNKEITSEFNRINGRISSQGSFTSGSNAAGSAFSKLGSQLGGIQGLGMQGSSGAGKAESAENDVQAQLQGLLAKIKHYEAQLAALDQNINQLKWARKQLTKDQMAGNGSLTALSKGVTAAALAERAQNWRDKAQNKRRESNRLSNKF